MSTGVGAINVGADFVRDPFRALRVYHGVDLG